MKRARLSPSKILKSTPITRAVLLLFIVIMLGFDFFVAVIGTRNGHYIEASLNFSKDITERVSSYILAVVDLEDHLRANPLRPDANSNMIVRFSILKAMISANSVIYLVGFLFSVASLTIEIYCSNISIYMRLISEIEGWKYSINKLTLWYFSFSIVSMYVVFFSDGIYFGLFPLYENNFLFCFSVIFFLLDTIFAYIDVDTRNILTKN